MVFCFDNLLEFSIILFGRKSEEVIWRGAGFLGGGSRELFCSELAHFGRDTKPLECLGVLVYFCK